MTTWLRAALVIVVAVLALVGFTNPDLLCAEDVPACKADR